MHALFVSLTGGRCGLIAGPHVHLFDTEAEALAFAVDSLIRAGEIAVTEVRQASVRIGIDAPRELYQKGGGECRAATR